MTPEQLREFAILGARSRLAELDNERDKILEEFAELGKARRAKAAEPNILYDGTAPLAIKGRVAAPALEAKKQTAVSLREAGLPSTEIAKRLGSSAPTVRAWLQEAGIDTSTHGSRATPGTRRSATNAHITDAMRSKALKLLAAGASTTAAAKAAGVTTTSVRRWRDEAKIKPAPRGKPSKAPPRSAESRATDQKLKAIALVRDGASTTKAGKVLGVSRATVARWARKAGVNRPFAFKGAKKPTATTTARGTDRVRKHYDHDFKVKAVALAKELGNPSAAAKILGIPSASVSNWVGARGLGNGVPSKPAQQQATLALDEKKKEPPPRGAGYVVRRRMQGGQMATIVLGSSTAQPTNKEYTT